VRPGRIVAVVLGTLLALIGAVIVAAAIGVLALAGFDNTVDTDNQRLVSETAAITLGAVELEGERPTGWPFSDEDELAVRIDATSAGGEALFLGVGPTADVERYRAPVAYDEIDDVSFNPFALDYDRRPAAGTGGTLDPPADQTFWTAQAEGPQSSVQMDWDFAPGRYTLVLMNGDGSPGIDADASLELEVPFLQQGLWIAAGVGALIFLIGLLIALFVARGSKAPPTAVATAAPAEQPPAAPARPPDET
jgi:hypothetical protein